MTIRRQNRQGAQRGTDRSGGYRLLCAVLASIQTLLPTLAAALPTDGHVVAGQATIQQASPTTLSITQASDKAILNWNSFSISGNEAVHFSQPSVSSIALNRVIGVDPSVILGQLQSNGRIFLINPNGILFGAGAQINVGGLLATTLQTRDEDFMAGRYLFAQDPLKGLKTVVNRGTIHVSDNGYVVLMAPGVSNEGVIVANLGTALLGSGQKFTLDPMGDGLIRYAINDKVLGRMTGPDGKPLTSAVSNSGSIQADGGQVILQAKAAGDIFSSVVNQSGVIRARSLENHGGVVQLLGGDETLVAATSAGAMRPTGEVSGAVVNSGTIDVAVGAPNAAQGSVTMVGERVGQFGSIAATGAGGVNGGDVVIASTTRTLLANGSTIDISGIGHSSGGRLRVWSDHNTFFDSRAIILARGGELGGNGGFVELSGKENLGFAGTVNALAPFGSAGTLLLDPRNITIAAAGGVPYNPGVNNLFGNNLGATTIITPASINGQLANVVLQANNDITVTNAIAMTNAGVGITMQAGRSIAVNANVSTTNGNISLTANDSAATAADRLAGAGNITMGAGATLNAGSGNISLTIGNSVVAPFSSGGITARALTTTAGTISLQSTTASTVSGNVAFGTGSLSLNNAGALTISGVISGAGGLTKIGAGTLTLSGANTYTGATSVNAGTLQLGAANRIANTSAITVAGGATFDLNSFAETIGSLSGAGAVRLGSATLTTGDATNTTYSGVMSGTGGLTKAGTGIFTLSGANTYTGATAINAGTLQVAGGSAIADTSAVTLANVAGATLDLNGTSETIGSLAGGGAAGGNVALGAGTLTTGGNNGTTTYTGILSGTGGLTKQGTGIFTLSGANTYTGATTINTGTLTLGAANRIADTSALTVAGGATFNLNNFAETIGSLAGAGNVTLSTGILTAGGDNSSTTFSGVMSGTGGLTKQGTGTFTLSGNNTYSGVTNVNAGTLQVAGGSAIADTSAVTLTNVAGATLDLNGTSETIGSLAGGGAAGGNVALGAGTLTTGGNNGTTTYTGILSGTGGLTKQGTGIFTLSGANTYTGATTINAGTLRVAGGAAIADTSAVTLANVAGAILDLNGTSETIGSLAGGGAAGGNVTLGTGILTAGGDNSSTTFSGMMSGTGGLTKQGAGTLTLSGNNTYTGATNINVGTLTLGAANRIANTSAITVAGGATFDLNSFAETIGSLSGAGAVRLGSATLTTGDATNTTYSGVMSGTGGLTKAGTGIFTLSGANTYTGATAINAGTLQVAGGSAIADTSAVTLTNVAGATLDLNGTSETIGSLAGGGAAGGNVALGAGTLTTGGNNGTTTYTGILSGTGGLTKQGTGIFTLSGANTYTGATTINTGTLTLGAANRIADTSALTVAGGATFNLNNFAETIGSLAGAGNVTLSTGILTAGGDNSSTTFSGVMSGTGGLTKQGTGTFTLSGNNTYSGVTNVNAGTLVAAVNNALGTVAGGTTVAAGATLGFSGGINYSTAEPVTLNTGATLSNLAGINIFAGPISLAAGSETITTALGTTLTANGVISGAGALTKDGTGTLIYGGANTYTGATNINAGTVQLDAANRIADTNAVTVNAGAAFNLNNFAETIGSLSGAGNVTLGTAILTTGDATNTTFSGVMSGTGGLAKAGTDIFTLSGANTYTGATTINAGTLTLGAANRIADVSAVTVAGGATFNLNNFSETVGSLAGAGNVTLGTGTLTAGGDNTSTAYSGIMSGTGGLSKQGTGTFTLSGNNTYSGATTINAGTLVAAVNNALGTAAGGTTVSAGATLGFSGGINYATAEPVTLNGGTLASLAGNNTFAGSTTLTANSAITVANGTTMTVGGTVNGGSQLNVTSGTGGINFLSAIGGTTPLSSLTATVGSISLGPVTTVGVQTYTGTTTLNGNMTTTNSAITLNSPVTLGANTILNAGAGPITFGNTLNGAFSLAANSTGTTTFGGAVSGATALTSLTTNVGGTTAINGGSITTLGNQTYNDNVTMNQTTTLTSAGGTITFGGNATNNAAGTGITVDAPTINLTGGTTVATTGNGPINFFTDTLNPNGSSINVGIGAFSLSPNVLTRTIEFGDVDTGRVTDVYYGSNFAGVTAGSFTIGRPTHTGNIFVTGVAAAPSAINVVNGGAGSVTFENAPYVSGNQDLGIASGSGGIAVDSSLTIGTGTLRLTTSGAITQTAGAITANIAGLSAGTGITLAQPANNVTTLAAQTTAGNIFFTDTDGFSIGGVSATVDGFHPAITDFTANAGTITLQSGGLVTQTQRILASALSLQGSGPYQLTNGANDVTSLAANTTGNVQYNDATALVLGPSSITGGLDVTTGGAITQSGAVTVTGTTTLAAGAANDITLTNAGNNFSTVGIASGNNVTLNDTNALILGASTVTGTLGITTNGALTQSGVLTVTGVTTLAAGGNDITLNNAANDFSTVGITSGNNVSLTDTNALVLGASTVTGNLALTTGGPLSQTGTLVVTGTTSFTATAANTDILLDTQANNFGGALSFAGAQSNFRDVQLRNVNAGATVPVLAGLTNLRNLTLTFDNASMTLPTLMASGNVNLTAGGSINQSGALTVGGTTTLATTAAGSDFLLDTQANNLGGAVSFGGTQSNIRDVGLRNINAGAIVPALAGLTSLRNLTLTFDNAPVTLPTLTLTAGGSLNVTAGGAITDSGNLIVTGTTTLVAGVNDIVLNNANDFIGAVSIANGNNVTLNDINVLDLGVSTVGGNLNVTTGGALTQSGALTVAGTTTLAAGGNDITLTNGANNFSTVGITSGNNVALTDANALNLAASAIGGTLNVTAGGLISQSGALSVAGNAVFDTTAAATLGSVTLANGGALTLGTSTVGGNLVATTTVGDLTLPVGQTLTVVGDATLASAGNVNLLGTTRIGGTQTLNGGTGSTIILAGDMNLNSLALPAAGDITVNTTGTTASFAGGPILPVAINLSNASNSFGSSVQVTTAAPAFTGSTTATYNLTQSASVSLNAGQTLSVTDLGGTAGTRGNIMLTNAGNSFNTVNFTGGNIAWQEANAVTIGTVSANAGITSSGALSITANGPITQTATVTAAGTTSLTAGANDITLINAANNFGTVSITSGNNVSLTDANALDLGVSSIAGTLNLTVNGTLTQSGALTVAGATTLAAGTANDITLNNAANNFSIVGITSGDNVTLNDTNALNLAASTVSGNLTVTSGGSLTQSGALIVTGTTNLASTATNSDILLDTQANNFGGAVAFGGTQANIRDVSLRNVNAGATVLALAGLTNLRNLALTFDAAPINLPTLNASGNLSATAGGSITQSGALTVGGATTLTTTVAGSDILLDTQANNFGGAVAFGGAQTNIRDIGLRNLNASATIPALAGMTNLRNLTLTFDNAPIAIPSLTTSGNLSATAGGAITQTGPLTIAGITTLAAGINDITLTNGANNFSTVGITSGNNVSLVDSNALGLGASTVTGNLNVTTGGALTQSGALTVAGTTTLVAGANDITLNNAGNNFSTVGVTSGNNVTLTDANALTITASTVSGNFSANASDLTVGGPVASTGGNLDLTGANTVTQLANLTAAGANTVTVTTAGGPITMAATSTTTSGTGGINYTAGSDVTLGSLSTGGGVHVSAGGSVLSAAGPGTNVTAGANSTLQAFNGVVGTSAAPVTVNINPGTLSIRATTAVAGISAFLTGTVLPSNTLMLLNVPPRLVCFNGCPVTGGTGGLAGLPGNAFGTLAYLNPDAIVPTYYPQPSRSVLISDITSVYILGTLLQPSPVSLSSGSPAVQSMGPKAKAGASCKQGETVPNQQAAAASFDVRCAVQ